MKCANKGCKNPIHSSVGKKRFCSRTCREQSYYAINRERIITQNSIWQKENRIYRNIWLKQRRKRAQPKEKKCICCGVAFFSIGRKKFCNTRCRNKFYRKDKIIFYKICVRCGDDFKSTSKQKNYCSDTCRTVDKTTRWRLRNPDKLISQNKRYRDKNYEKLKQKELQLSKDRIKNLRDTYVKLTIKKQNGIPFNIITPEMIEIQRETIKLKRKIYEKQRHAANLK